MGAATRHNSLLGKGEDSLDLSNNIPYADISGAQACVRIVPNNTAVDDNWVMRNISVPYRTAPKKDNPDMYEIRSEGPDVPLAPGRYALVLKGLAYDFTVAGPITDPRQCLERLVANNGRFYSECRKK